MIQRDFGSGKRKLHVSASQSHQVFGSQPSIPGLKCFSTCLHTSLRTTQAIFCCFLHQQISFPGEKRKSTSAAFITQSPTSVGVQHLESFPQERIQMEQRRLSS